MILSFPVMLIVAKLSGMMSLCQQINPPSEYEMTLPYLTLMLP